MAPKPETMAGVLVTGMKKAICSVFDAVAVKSRSALKA